MTLEDKEKRETDEAKLCGHDGPIMEDFWRETTNQNAARRETMCQWIQTRGGEDTASVDLKKNNPNEGMGNEYAKLSSCVYEANK